MILLITILVILIIGIVTSFMNYRPKCAHDWEDFNNGSSKCLKCDKIIYPMSKNQDFAS
ncbi:MAG: hypothetical protein JWR54_3474 [Mucilaginibacter sp.]|nr:hypothetical protein [Mucilaginibacter sp.]